MSEDRRRMFPDQNPFSTGAVMPGAITFKFDQGDSAASLVAKLKANNWRGEIVGPHGSGKSSLLQALLPLIEAENRTVCRYLVTPQSRDLPLESDECNAWDDKKVVVVEGYELLSRRNQRRLDRLCTQHGAGLLITCHAPQGLPIIYETKITIELVTSIVGQLLPEGCDLITTADIERGFGQHGQNLRELLFGLYDLYEARQRG